MSTLELSSAKEQNIFENEPERSNSGVVFEEENSFIDEETPTETNKSLLKQSTESQKALAYPFRVCNQVHEYSHKSSIYAVAFNHYDTSASPIFATAAKNEIHIYSCPANSRNIILKRVIIDTNTCEDFYALDWCYDQDVRRPRILVSGDSGIIKVIDPETGALLEQKYGHGDVVNEIRTDPNNCMIFASVSKDNSARIWSLRHKEALISLGGFHGHTDQVISCDWSPDSHFLVTCGMDHSIRLWRIDSHARKLIKKTMRDILDPNISSSSSDDENEPSKKPYLYNIQLPTSECPDFHTDYVDCVRYFGWYLIAKGSEKAANIFRFGHYDEAPDAYCKHAIDRSSTLIRQLQLPKCDVWFLKFDISPLNDWVVFGGTDGCLYFFNIRDFQDTANFKICISKKSIRQVCFDANGDNLIAVSDDSSVTRLQRKRDY